MTTTLMQAKPELREKSDPSEIEKIVEECMEKKGSWGLLQNDILFAVTFWFMTECGFNSVQKVTSDKSKPVDGDKMPTLPDNWKHGSKEIYEAQFILPPHDDHLVRLVALPADDILCINVLVSNMSPKSVSLKSLAVSSSGFVPRPEARIFSSKFCNLEMFRLHLRSAIIWPIRCSILTSRGIANGSLSGLSDEIKLKILYFLDVRDLLAVSETCQDLNRVTNDQGLWKEVFHKHFKHWCKCRGKTKNCDDRSMPWKENFKNCYKFKMAAKTSLHSSSAESFHTAPEAFYDADLSYE